MAGAEPVPKQFSREGTLRTVTKFVACDDQVWGSGHNSVVFQVLTH